MKKINIIIALSLASGMIVNAFSPFENIILNAAESEEKIAVDVMELMSSEESEIPIVIWNRHINDSEIEDQIEDAIGYSLYDLEEKYVAPSQELLNELAKAAEKSPEYHLETLMREHLELTATSREIERKKTELYLKTRRKCVSDFYSSEANTVINSNFAHPK